MTLDFSLSIQSPIDSGTSGGLTGSGGLLLTAAALGYLACSAVARAVDLPRTRTASVLLRCEDRRCLVRMLLDTGNTLRDGVTGAPVLIGDERVAQRLFPACCCPTAEQLRHPERALAQLSEVWEPSRLRLLPYRGVGVESGLLLAVRTDSIEVEGRPYHGRLVALMSGSLSHRYHGLIGL